MKKALLLIFILITSLISIACSDGKNTSKTTKEAQKINSSDHVEKVKLIPITGGFYELESSGHILKKQIVQNKNKSAIIDRRIKEINKLVSDNPDVKFFLYHITQGSELNYFDWGIKKEPFNYYDEYIKEKLSPTIKTDKLKINSVEEYIKYFYKYDHHWTSYGIDVGYEDVFNLLSTGGVDMQPMLTVKEKVTIPGVEYFGSRARQMDVSNMEGDLFIVNKYDGLDYELFCDNVNLGKWAKFDDFKNGNVSNKERYEYYNRYYGGEAGDINSSNLSAGKVRIKTKLDNNKNAVFVGDSFLKGLYEPLAQNFDTSWYVWYWPQFDLNNFIKSNNVEVVLYLGSVSLWKDDNDQEED